MDTIQVGRYTLHLVKDVQPCGDCRACCTVLGVQEFDKPNYKSCEQECDKGCAIYERRPASCRSYTCLWKVGWLQGDERRRPDRLGVIFDWQPEHETLRVWEVWPGACREPQASYLIEKLRKKYPVLVWTEALERQMEAEQPDWHEQCQAAQQTAMLSAESLREPLLAAVAELARGQGTKRSVNEEV
jgi:hypothetical protein